MSNFHFDRNLFRGLEPQVDPRDRDLAQFTWRELYAEVLRLRKEVRRLGGNP